MNKKKMIRRREMATANKDLRGKRTPQEQLSLLDERLGVGKGAAKERFRLQYAIDNPVKGRGYPSKSKKRDKRRTSKTS